MSIQVTLEHTTCCANMLRFCLYTLASDCVCPVEKGIKLVQEGQYSQAVSMFTEAIRYNPKDYR